MNEYAKIARRLENIKKTMKEEKKKPSLLPRSQEGSKLQDEHPLGSSINQLIAVNTRKEVANQEKVVLDADLGFPNYVNAINSFRNPDILTGDARGKLAGNKYRAKMVGVDEDMQEEDKVEDGAIKEESEKESEEEALSDPEIPSRYYHKESKGIRCRNCKEIGHMARNCPNESKIPLCKYCGTAHPIEIL